MFVENILIFVPDDFIVDQPPSLIQEVSSADVPQVWPPAEVWSHEIKVIINQGHHQLTCWSTDASLYDSV